jgi:predicted anti-sigma-YlaC factor YlaD
MTSGFDPRCQAARVWISAAVDSEATDAERMALRLHLSECEACRSWAAQAESISLQVRTAAPVEASRPFAFPETATARRTRRTHQARVRVAAFASPLLAAAAIGGVLLSGALEPAPQTRPRAPKPPVITVAVSSQGFVAGLPVAGGVDVLPRDGRPRQPAPEPVPRNLALPGDNSP